MRGWRGWLTAEGTGSQLKPTPILAASLSFTLWCSIFLSSNVWKDSQRVACRQAVHTLRHVITFGLLCLQMVAVWSGLGRKKNTWLGLGKDHSFV